MRKFKYTDEIAMANIQALLRLYQRANPKLDRAECIKLMLKNERKFFGLDIKRKPNKKMKSHK